MTIGAVWTVRIFCAVMAAVMPITSAAAASAVDRRAEAGVHGVKTVMVGDVVWAYRDKGSGRPAVMIHPFIGDSTLWLDQINGLKDIRRVIAPDLRGFGESEPVTDTQLSPERYARDIIAFLDAIGVKEPVDLVGMSVGAFVAGLVYEMAPDRVASITLVSGTFNWTRDLPYERYQAELARTGVVEGRDAVFRRFDEYIRGKSASLHARARYKSMLFATRHEMLVASLVGMGENKPRPDLPAKIKVPVLLPIGTQDSVITPDMIRKMESEFPDARVVTIPDAGRLLPLENPKLLNQALREFWTTGNKRN